MSKAYKAEQRALEAYPVLMCYNDFQMVEEDINKPLREIYQEGYNQAEKDNELTWEDMRIVLDAENDILRECNFQKELVIKTYPKGEDYYGEILKRFKNLKK